MGASGQFTLASLSQNRSTQAAIGEQALPYPSAPIRARSLEAPAGSTAPAGPTGHSGQGPAGQSGPATPIGSSPSPWLRGSMRTREAVPPPAQNGAVRSNFEPAVGTAAPSGGQSGYESGLESGYESSYESGFESSFEPGFRPPPEAAEPAPGMSPPPPRAPAPAQPQIKLRTAHGLPKRVPLDRLPAEALTEQSEVEAAPAERDPSRVSASMAAYVRGIGGHNAPGASQIPYTPSPNSGTY
jgi:hypothetical protein